MYLLNRYINSDLQMHRVIGEEEEWPVTVYRDVSRPCSSKQEQRNQEKAHQRRLI